jgi:threonine dehydratase
VACTIVVPRGNSVEKNAAMRALGVTLVEHGDDFQESREHALHLAATRGAHMVPSFHTDLLQRRQHLLAGILPGRAAA